MCISTPDDTPLCLDVYPKGTHQIYRECTSSVHSGNTSACSGQSVHQSDSTLSSFCEVIVVFSSKIPFVKSNNKCNKWWWLQKKLSGNQYKMTIGKLRTCSSSLHDFKGDGALFCDIVVCCMLPFKLTNHPQNEVQCTDVYVIAKLENKPLLCIHGTSWHCCKFRMLISMVLPLCVFISLQELIKWDTIRSLTKQCMTTNRLQGMYRSCMY